MTAPLTDLASPKRQFVWTPQHTAAFDTVKLAMASPQVLALPDWTLPFILATDASDVGLGGVLMQHFPSDPAPRPIVFLSRKLQQAERNYAVTEREALAVIECVNRLRFYLLGNTLPCRIVTDHSALTYLLAPDPATVEDPTRVPGRIVRWRLTLADYNYTIEHMPGKRMVVPDFLSRYATGDLTQISEFFAKEWPGLTAALLGPSSTTVSMPVFAIERPDAQFLVELQLADPICEALRAAANGRVEEAETKLLAIYNIGRPAMAPLTYRPSRWRGIGDLKQYRLSDKDVLVRVDEEGRRQLVVPPPTGEARRRPCCPHGCASHV